MIEKLFLIVPTIIKGLNDSYYGIWSPAALGSSRSAAVQLRVLWSGLERGGRGERRDFAGAGGGVGSEEAGAAARGMTDGLAEVNAKAINPTSGWPQVPIKFIYIFTLRPPLKHLCLDFFKSSVTRLYISARTSNPDPSKSRLTSSCLNFPLKALLLIARLHREFLFSTVRQLHLQLKWLGWTQRGILVLKPPLQPIHLTFFSQINERTNAIDPSMFVRMGFPRMWQQLINRGPDIKLQPQISKQFPITGQTNHI